MTVSLKKQSPDDWLLAQYDQTGWPRHRAGNHVRPIFELVDDHKTAGCVDYGTSDCRYWSGQARWPIPNAYAELSREAFGRPWSQDFLEMMEAA